MENTYLFQVIQEIRKDIEYDFEKALSNLNHKGLKGTASEIAVMSKFFEERFPFLGVGGGEIVGTNGFRSTQTDIILYDKIKTPLFYKQSQNIQVIPIEGVFATAEVKSFLSSGYLIDSINTSAVIKQVPKTAFWSKTKKWRYNFYNKDYDYYPIFTMVIALDSVGFNTIGEKLVEKYKTLRPENRLDFIYVIKKGLIFIDRMDNEVRLVEDIDEALFTFYGMTHAYLSLTHTPSIRLHDYAGNFQIQNLVLKIKDN